MYSFGSPSDISSTVQPISTEIFLSIHTHTHLYERNACGIAETKTARIVRSHNEMSMGLKSGDLDGHRNVFHDLSI